MLFKKIILLAVSIPIIITLLPWFVASAEGVETRYRLQREDLFKRSDGSRIDRSKLEKCKHCSSRDDQAKSLYLERSLSSDLSKDYQKLIELKIFSDQKFTTKCWDKAASKDIDFFFTVSQTGQAEDFAWFPNKSAAKCIQRHIKSIEFPVPDGPHHAWLLVTDI